MGSESRRTGKEKPDFEVAGATKEIEDLFLAGKIMVVTGDELPSIYVLSLTSTPTRSEWDFLV
jgi:hypothetical protein